MSWKSGGDLFGRIARVLSAKLPAGKERENLYAELIDAFEVADCDTLYHYADLDEDMRKAWIRTGHEPY